MPNDSAIFLFLNKNNIEKRPNREKAAMNVSRNHKPLITTEKASTDLNSKYPTVEFKSLLQNSDLLEILLKPLSEETEVSSNSNSPSASSSASNFEIASTDLNHQLDVLSNLPGLNDATCASKSTLDCNSDEYLESKIVYERHGT